MKNLYTIGLLLSIATLACKSDHKHGVNPSDTTKPLISITAPSEGNSYSAATPVELKGLVTDESLHEVKWAIRQKADGAVLAEEIKDVHGLKSYTLEATYNPIGLRRPTAAILTVKASDANKNADSVSLSFIITP